MTYAELARKIKFLTGEQQNQPIIVSDLGFSGFSGFMEISELKVVGDDIPLYVAHNNILSEGRVILLGEKFV
jgi:hypothetical protein